LHEAALSTSKLNFVVQKHFFFGKELIEKRLPLMVKHKLSESMYLEGIRFLVQ
jgi:hypothetical protein